MADILADGQSMAIDTEMIDAHPQTSAVAPKKEKKSKDKKEKKGKKDEKKRKHSDVNGGVEAEVNGEKKKKKKKHADD